MKPIVRNLFAQASSPKGEEEVRPLINGQSFKLESIHSYGQPSPKGFWYDQPGDEWVLLARGSTRLEFEGEGMIDLQSGDHLLIPAHCRHRVVTVSVDAVWLALHADARLYSET
jgi:cupin 2 domain-containing protein